MDASTSLRFSEDNLKNGLRNKHESLQTAQIAVLQLSLGLLGQPFLQDLNSIFTAIREAFAFIESEAAPTPTGASPTVPSPFSPVCTPPVLPVVMEVSKAAPLQSVSPTNGTYVCHICRDERTLCASLKKMKKTLGSKFRNPKLCYECDSMISESEEKLAFARKCILLASRRDMLLKSDRPLAEGGQAARVSTPTSAARKPDIDQAARVSTPTSAACKPGVNVQPSAEESDRLLAEGGQAARVSTPTSAARKPKNEQAARVPAPTPAARKPDIDQAARVSAPTPAARKPGFSVQPSAGYFRPRCRPNNATYSAWLNLDPNTALTSSASPMERAPIMEAAAPKPKDLLPSIVASPPAPSTVGSTKLLERAPFMGMAAPMLGELCPPVASPPASSTVGSTELMSNKPTIPRSTPTPRGRPRSVAKVGLQLDTFQAEKGD